MAGYKSSVILLADVDDLLLYETSIPRVIDISGDSAAAGPKVACRPISRHLDNNRRG